MDWIVKDKKTGEIKTITSTCYGSSGQKVRLCGKDGIIKEIVEKEFNKKYVPVEYDFSRIYPYLTSAVDELEEVRRILRGIMRKTDPDYYHIGDIVFLDNINDPPSVFGEYIKSSRYNPDCGQFMIVGINKCSFCGPEFMIYLEPYYPGKKTKGPKKVKNLGFGLDGAVEITEDFEYSPHAFGVPYFKSLPFAHDAAYCLKRYDKEY